MLNKQKDILSCLVPQFFENVPYWQLEVQEVAARLTAYELNPLNEPIDVSQWPPDVERPNWSPAGHKIDLNDPGLSHALDPTVSPIFGWVAMAKWSKASKEIKTLFHVLMRCGCMTSEMLNLQDMNGVTALAFSVGLQSKAAELLLSEPEVQIPTSGVCQAHLPYCLFCLCMYYKKSRLALLSIARARLPTSDDFTPSASALAGHLHLALTGDMGDVFSALWRDICRFVKAKGGSLKDSMASIATVILGDGEMQYTLLSSLARCADSFAWKLFTRVSRPMKGVSNFHALMHMEMMQHANLPNQSAPEMLNPMIPVMSLSDKIEADRRASWLVPRLNANQLNRFHWNGLTPLGHAVANALPLTIRGLLARAPHDVDLTACMAVVTLPASGIARMPFNPMVVTRVGQVTFGTRTAMDLLSEKVPPALQNVAKALRMQTQKLLDESPAKRADEIRVALMHSGPAAQAMPLAVVKLCLAYAALLSV